MLKVSGVRLGEVLRFFFMMISNLHGMQTTTIIFKGVKGQILERSVISMLKNGVLLTNVLSNDNRKLNALDHENCDKDKDESCLKDCSSQTVSQL